MMRLLHTMLRVVDLEASKKFYCEGLGMKVLRESHFPGGKFTLTFVGYEAESEAAAIELTHNWETSSYNVGDGYGHVAIGTDDINATCKRVKDLGFVVAREPGPMQHGTTVIAFVQDPTGYKVELIEKKA